jgi:hypothetical protein
LIGCFLLIVLSSIFSFEVLLFHHPLLGVATLPVLLVAALRPEEDLP